MASGVTKNGGRSWPGSEASILAPADVPSPHVMRELAGVGFVSPLMVGLMPRPAPVSMIISPSGFWLVAKIADRRCRGNPGSNGNALCTWIFLNVSVTPFDVKDVLVAPSMFDDMHLALSSVVDVPLAPSVMLGDVLLAPSWVGDVYMTPSLISCVPFDMHLALSIGTREWLKSLPSGDELLGACDPVWTWSLFCRRYC